WRAARVGLRRVPCDVAQRSPAPGAVAADRAGVVAEGLPPQEAVLLVRDLGRAQIEQRVGPAQLTDQPRRVLVLEVIAADRRRPVADRAGVAVVRALVEP